MLVVKQSHGQYQNFVSDFLTHYFISTGQHITVLTRSSLVVKLWNADLTGIVHLLKNQYSITNRGTPPKDAAAMFRSLVLMTLTGETSIPKWVDTLKSDPFLAVLSGFLPACFSSVKADDIPADLIPGIGTLKPGERCDCPRLFADPTASWGWDSCNEHYFYGHTFHGFTACDSFYSLPIHIKCVSGERHDSVTGAYELKELVDLYPEINFYSAAFDSAYDANAFYLLNKHYGIKPIIDLNSRASKPAAVNELVEFDKNGIPHCKFSGHQLRNWGLMSKSYRRKWLFPVQCDACNNCHACSKQTFYTKTDDNPRFFTPILRGSDEWKQLYKRRSTTERVWDRINNDFHAESAVVLSKERRSLKKTLS